MCVMWLVCTRVNIYIHIYIYIYDVARTHKCGDSYYTCNVTHLYVCVHVIVTHSYVCDVTCSHTCDMTRILPVVLLIYMHAYIESWLIHYHTCNMTHSRTCTVTRNKQISTSHDPLFFLIHDSFIYVWRDSYHTRNVASLHVCILIIVLKIREMWLAQSSVPWLVSHAERDCFTCMHTGNCTQNTCDATRAWYDLLKYVWHDSCQTRCMTYSCVCAVTHSHVCCDSFSCVPWFIHMCAVTRSHVCRDSFTCVPWLAGVKGISGSMDRWNSQKSTL